MSNENTKKMNYKAYSPECALLLKKSIEAGSPLESVQKDAEKWGIPYGTAISWYYTIKRRKDKEEQERKKKEEQKRNLQYQNFVGGEIQRRQNLNQQGERTRKQIIQDYISNPYSVLRRNNVRLFLKSLENFNEEYGISLETRNGLVKLGGLFVSMARNYAAQSIESEKVIRELTSNPKLSLEEKALIRRIHATQSHADARMAMDLAFAAKKIGLDSHPDLSEQAMQDLEKAMAKFDDNFIDESVNQDILEVERVE